MYNQWVKLINVFWHSFDIFWQVIEHTIARVLDIKSGPVTPPPQGLLNTFHTSWNQSQLSRSNWRSLPVILFKFSEYSINRLVNYELCHITHFHCVFNLVFNLILVRFKKHHHFLFTKGEFFPRKIVWDELLEGRGKFFGGREKFKWWRFSMLKWIWSACLFDFLHM